MDERLKSQEVPLAVDLDGTLVATDLLWESAFILLKRNPLFLFLFPIWLLSGKANLKQQIASRISMDAGLLPYRRDFLDYLRQEHMRGRRLVLATAAAEPLARAVAAELGIFEAVLATSGKTNLSSHRKAQALIAQYGPNGFDYAGNDRADLAVFAAAREAVVVAPDRAA